MNYDLVASVPNLPRPREAVHASQVRRMPGGKGYNQAIAARRLGADVVFAGAVGRDAFGDEFLGLLDGEGIDRRHVAVVDAPTGLAVPMVDPAGQNCIVVALGANVVPLELGREFLRGADVLLLQGELAPETTLEVARLAVASGVPILLNLAPADRRLEPAVPWAAAVVVNEIEEADLGGEERLRALGAQEVVVTMGERGARAGRLAIPAPAVDAVDTTGAGDAFCGALAVALAERRSLEEGLRFAVAAGSAACTRPGTSASMPSRAEVQALYRAIA